MSSLSGKERGIYYPILAERDGEICQKCKKSLQEAGGLVVHQKKYERPLNPENMLLLCRSCDHRIQNVPKELRRKPRQKRDNMVEDRDEIYCFLLARDGYKCNDKRGNGCGKTIDELLSEVEAKEEQTGIMRMNPVVVIDHINDIPYQKHSEDKEIYGNLQLLCYPCNIRKQSKIRIISNSERMTREKRDSIQIPDKLFKGLQNYLVAYEHICYNEMLAVGQKWAGGVQITIQRHFETEIRTKPNPTGKYTTFPYECNGKLCNGVHVCFAGQIPQIVIDQKRHEFTEEWNREYGWETKEEWNKRPTDHISKEFVGKEEYVKQKLQNHFKSQYSEP